MAQWRKAAWLMEGSGSRPVWGGGRERQTDVQTEAGRPQGKCTLPGHAPSELNPPAMPYLSTVAIQ